MLWRPPGRLRLVNDAPASTEFEVTCSPLPVSICTARQFTSTTRPRAEYIDVDRPCQRGAPGRQTNVAEPERHVAVGEVARLLH
jgi:hypothetical protein